MFQIPDSYTAFNNYQILRMSKALYDYKKDLIEKLKGNNVDSDFMYEVFWISLNAIVSGVRTYYSESWEGEFVFLRDNRIDKYFQLVFEYSKLTGLKENSNPYFKDVMSEIDNSLSYQDNMYDCAFKYNKKTYKACRIFLSLFGEFTYYYEIVVGMIQLIEFLEEKTEKLQMEIESIKRLEAVA